MAGQTPLRCYLLYCGIYIKKPLQIHPCRPAWYVLAILFCIKKCRLVPSLCLSRFRCDQQTGVWLYVVEHGFIYHFLPFSCSSLSGSYVAFRSRIGCCGTGTSIWDWFVYSTSLVTYGLVVSVVVALRSCRVRCEHRSCGRAASFSLIVAYLCSIKSDVLPFVSSYSLFDGSFVAFRPLIGCCKPFWMIYIHVRVVRVTLLTRAPSS